MTPKEKAKQMVDQYLDIFPSRNSIMYIPDVETAQKCALRAVDEIIEEMVEWAIIPRIDYWSEVRQEIEKL